ncbi:MAG: FHA domain-containing protein [Planctomycetaceae bacterium]
MSHSSLGELLPCGGGDPVPLLKPRLVIGRRNRCDIVLEFPNVSSQHCELELKNGFWHIQDLGSSNGIKVNGERCDSQWLQPGDNLSVAKHQFTIHYVPSGDAPPIEESDPFGMSLMEKAGLSRRKPKGSTESAEGNGSNGSAARKPPSNSQAPRVDGVRRVSNPSRFDVNEEAAFGFLDDPE